MLVIQCSMYKKRIDDIYLGEWWQSNLCFGFVTKGCCNCVRSHAKSKLRVRYLKKFQHQFNRVEKIQVQQLDFQLL